MGTSNGARRGSVTLSLNQAGSREKVGWYLSGKGPLRTKYSEHAKARYIPAYEIVKSATVYGRSPSLLMAAHEFTVKSP